MIRVFGMRVEVRRTRCGFDPEAARDGIRRDQGPWATRVEAAAEVGS
jgi:hypothetical protein